MKAAWMVRRLSRPLIGTGSAARVAARRWSARRLSLASLMASHRDSAVMVVPHSSSRRRASFLTSPFQSSSVRSSCTLGMSTMYMGFCVAKNS